MRLINNYKKMNINKKRNKVLQKHQYVVRPSGDILFQFLTWYQIIHLLNFKFCNLNLSILEIH